MHHRYLSHGADDGFQQELSMLVVIALNVPLTRETFDADHSLLL